MEFQDNQRVIILGCFTKYRGQTVSRILRVNCFGDIDTTFLGGTRFGSSPAFSGPNVLVIKKDTSIFGDNSRIICAGLFTTYDGQPRNSIVRLLQNGSLDTGITFGTGFGGIIPAVYDLSLNSTDSRIAVGGQFSSYNGTTCNGVCVLDYSTGNVDTTFVRGSNFGFSPNSRVNGLEYQTDNKLILVGGTLTQYTCNNITTSVNNIVRLNTDGTVDNTFNVGTGPNAEIRKIKIQSDNKIIITGSFTTFNGVDKRSIVRLNADGSVDNTFDVGTGLSSSGVEKILIQSDGKIILLGSFFTYNSIQHQGIVRLNVNGTIDTTYNTGNGFFNANGSLGKILGTINQENVVVAGQSYTDYYNNTPIVSLAKISPNGNIQCPDFQLKCCSFNGGNSSFYRVRNCSDLGVGWTEFPNGCT